MRNLVSFLTVSALAGCMTATPFTPGEGYTERYSFNTSDGRKVYQYDCRSRGSEFSTRQYARSAHLMTERRVKALEQSAAARQLAGVSPATLDGYISRESQRLAADVDRTYGCVPTGFS